MVLWTHCIPPCGNTSTKVPLLQCSYICAISNFMLRHGNGSGGGRDAICMMRARASCNGKEPGSSSAIRELLPVRLRLSCTVRFHDGDCAASPTRFATQPRSTASSQHLGLLASSLGHFEVVSRRAWPFRLFSCWSCGRGDSKDSEDSKDTPAAMASSDRSALIVAGREHVVFCFDVLTSYFSGEALSAPTFAEAHWRVTDFTIDALCSHSTPPCQDPHLTSPAMTPVKLAFQASVSCSLRKRHNGAHL